MIIFLKRNKRIAFSTLFMLACLLCSSTYVRVWGQQKKARQVSVQSSNFDSVVKYTIKTLSKADWEGLRTIACPQIILLNVYQLRPSQLSGDLKKYIAEEDYTDVTNPSPTLEYNKNDEFGLSVDSSLAVDTAKPLSAFSKKAFENFCGLVQTSVDEGKYRKLRIRQGKFLHANDGFVILGPAVQGVITSDVNWRVDFQMTENGWRISRLVETEH